MTNKEKMAVISTEGRDLELLKLTRKEISPFGRNDRLADLVNHGRPGSFELIAILGSKGENAKVGWNVI